MKPGIKLFHSMQILFIVLVSIITLLLFGLNVAFSSLLGGLTALIPGIIFSLKLFRYKGARAAKKIVKSFYLGEALKISLSILLFSVVFLTYRVNAPAFFISYIAVVMFHWFTPIIINQYGSEK